MPDNWLENSCSCLYIAALCAAVRKGILDKSYLENLIRVWSTEQGAVFAGRKAGFLFEQSAEVAGVCKAADACYLCDRQHIVAQQFLGFIKPQICQVLLW